MNKETQAAVDEATKHLTDRFNQKADGQFRPPDAKDIGAVGILLSALISVTGGLSDHG